MNNLHPAAIHVLRLIREGWSLGSKDQSGLPAYLTSSRHEYIELATHRTMARLIEQGLVEFAGSHEATGAFVWKLTTSGKMAAANAEALAHKSRRRAHRDET